MDYNESINLYDKIINCKRCSQALNPLPPCGQMDSETIMVLPHPTKETKPYLPPFGFTARVFNAVMTAFGNPSSFSMTYYLTFAAFCRLKSPNNSRKECTLCYSSFGPRDLVPSLIKGKIMVLFGAATVLMSLMCLDDVGLVIQAPAIGVLFRKRNILLPEFINSCKKSILNYRAL